MQRSRCKFMSSVAGLEIAALGAGQSAQTYSHLYPDAVLVSFLSQVESGES